jgi:regulatory protein
MTGKDDKVVAKARAYALALIKFRVRSEKEVRDKLKTREIDPDVIDQVVAPLKKSRLIDDALFARLWVESRIKRPMGVARLRLELERKGLDKKIIDDAISAAQENYDEALIVRALAKDRASRMKDLAPDNIRARIYGYLVRRGFSKGRVLEALFELELPDEKTFDE